MRRGTPDDSWIARIRRRWVQQDGIALVLSLIVMGVLTVSTAAIITQTNSSEHAFGRDRQTNRALNIAEAGLNAGIATLQDSPASTTSLPGATGTLDHGSWSYTASRVQDDTDPDAYVWTITSTGTSPDTNVQRIISTKVRQTVVHHSSSTTISTPVSPAYLYGFFMGDPSSDCTTLGTGNSFSGNGDIRVDIYVRGSLCLQGNGAILQPTGTQGTIGLYVGRQFKYQGSPPTVGTSAARIRQATIVGGCLRNNSAVTCSSGNNSHVWANTYSSTQADIPKPPIDTATYTSARPGPTTGCNDDPTNAANVSTYPSGMTAAQFKSAVLDGNSTRDTSVGTVDLLALGNFDCRWYDTDGTLQGRFAWTNGSPGTLIVYGTVFMDANLTAQGQEYAVYQGRGNLYVNGTVSFAGQAQICATPISGTPCLGNYAPSTNLLELVAVNAGNAPNAFALTGQETFEGVAFMNGNFQEAGNGAVHGAVIADTASVSGNGSVPSQIDPPPGAPGAAATTTTTTSAPDTVAWDPVPGSWQQLK
jgi:Tfp pilus assembly protein PilX